MKFSSFESASQACVPRSARLVRNRKISSRRNMDLLVFLQKRPSTLEKEMYSSCERVWASILVLASVLIFLASSEVAAGEKFSYTKNAREVFAEEKIIVGDAPGHELARLSYRDSKVTATGWDFIEERGINQDDQVDGTGKHKGIAANIMRNGDTIFQVYEGTHKTTTKEGGAWETNYQGTMEFRGGTGKYKNAKGKGSYKGRITTDSFVETGEGEIQP